jgi:hypothetical protein
VTVCVEGVSVKITGTAVSADLGGSRYEFSETLDS